MKKLNERTSLTLSVSFFDENDAPVTPDNATYRIDDLNSGVVIVSPATIPNLAPTVEIEITSEQNRIVATDSRSGETRVVTIEFDYDGSTKHGTEEFRYTINNLFAVTNP